MRLFFKWENQPSGLHLLKISGFRYCSIEVLQGLVTCSALEQCYAQVHVQPHRCEYQLTGFLTISLENQILWKMHLSEDKLARTMKPQRLQKQNPENQVPCITMLCHSWHAWDTRYKPFLSHLQCFWPWNCARCCYCNKIGVENS